MTRKKPEVLLLIYGNGGHTAQMQRFLNAQSKELSNCSYVAITNSDKLADRHIELFYCIETRDKHSSLKSVFQVFVYLFFSFFQTIRLLTKYNVKGVISTGPGMAILPCIICKILRKKVIYFESWSRFTKKSLAGAIMYKVADLFFVQHKEMLMLYPKAIFKGRL